MSRGWFSHRWSVVGLVSALVVTLGSLLPASQATAQEVTEKSGLLDDVLGGLLLEELDDTREQPLFTPVRHPPLPPPPPPPPPKAPKVKKPKPVKAPPPKPPSLRLVGVVLAGKTKIAMVLDSNREMQRVAIGDEIEGWAVVKMGPSEVELTQRGVRSVYRMFRPKSRGVDANDLEGNERQRNKRKRKNRR